MDEEERRGGSGEDRISGLPDELLHDILVRLRSAHAAARTSLLSRRWRRVWAHLPELHFVAPPRAPAPASFPDAVDGALAGYLAPTLGYLNIFLQQGDDSITAARVAPWLQFAAEHMVGWIHLFVLPNPPQFLPSLPRLLEPEVVDDEAVLELPAWQGAKRIDLSLTDKWWLRLQASGVFTALTSMSIMRGRMKGSELTSLVCTQCPCLRHLSLFLKLIAVSDVLMHSNSLRSLLLNVRHTRRLEVVAPNLEELTVYYQPEEAHISAPKLIKVAWNADVGPQLNRFADVGRSLRVLDIRRNSAVLSLSQRFDKVDELKLSIAISQGVAGYESFLNQTSKIPKCKIFSIFLARGHHALVPSMLHLLKRCNSTKKISVLLLNPWGHSCSPPCRCRFEDNHKIDGIALSSLEEVEIKEFMDSPENMELVEFLSCNAASLKRLVINYTSFPAPLLTNEVCEKVRGICHANVEVKFNVFRCGRLVPFD